MSDNTFLRSPLRQLADQWNREQAALPQFGELADPPARPSRQVQQPQLPQQSLQPADLLPPPDLAPIFEQASRKYGVPANVLMALAQQESSYNANAVGAPTQWGRAKGIMQYLDDTARNVGINPLDPQQAIEGAARQYAERIGKGYSHEEAVMAHHGGDDRRQWGPNTRAYLETVKQKANAIGGTLQERMAQQQESRGGFDPRHPGEVAASAADAAMDDLRSGDPSEVASRLGVPNPQQALEAVAVDIGAQSLTEEEAGQYVATLPEPEKEAVAAGFWERLPQASKTGWENMTRSLAVTHAVLSDDFSPETVDLLADTIREQIEQAESDQARQHPSERRLKEAIEEFGESEGFVDTAVGLAKLLGTTFVNPKGLAIGTTEQLANMLPSIGGGLVGAGTGAGVGFAAGSVLPGPGSAVGSAFGALWGSRAGFATGTASLEYGFEITEAITDRLEDQGKQPTRDNIAELLSDPEVQREIRSQAARKGLTLAAVDALFMGLAGKIGARGLSQATRGGKAKYAAGALGVEMAGEPTAEAASQLVARGEIDKADVAAEGIYGAGTAAGGAAVGTGSQALYDRAMGGAEGRFARELERQVDRTRFIGSPEQVAAEQFGAELYPDDMPPPSRIPVNTPDPSGPIGRAMLDAIGPEVLAEQEAVSSEAAGTRVIARTPDGAITGTVDSIAPDGTIRILSEEGMMYEFGPQDVTLEPIAETQDDVQVRYDSDAGAPEAAPAGVDTEAGGPAVAPLDTDRGESPREPVAEREPAVPDADITNEQDASLTATEVAAESEAEAAPAREPAKWFGSEEKAQAWIDRQRDPGAYELVQEGRRFNIYEREEPADAVPDSAAPAPADLELKRDGTPFVSAQQAERAAKNRRLTGYVPVEVEGGWALAPASDQQEATPAQGAQEAEAESADDLLEMFLTPPEESASTQQAAPEQPSETVQPDLTDQQRTEVEHIDRLISSRRAQIDDLRGREYADNENRITVGDPDELLGEFPGGRTTTIGDLNERRRERSIRQLRQDIQDLENLKQKVVDGERSLSDLAAYYRESGFDGVAWEYDPRSAYMEVTKSGKPFASREGAERAMRNRRLEGYEPVEIEGGFALAPVGQAEAAPSAAQNGSVSEPAGQAAAPESEQAAAQPQESQAAAAEPSRPQVSENTIFTEDAAERARAILRSKLNQLNTGIDPEIMQAGITLAGYHIEKGARTFGAYARAMIDDMGDTVRPYLKSWYMGVKYDPRAAGFEGMSSAAEVEAFDVGDLDADAGQGAGRTETVATPSGREFEVRHKVVEAADLITSNDASGRINPDYPQELQPRNRSRAASQDQINDIASKLNPRLLGESASATDGAPIVSSGNVVESGNGRTLAIRQAYRRGFETADRYRAWLAEQGYDVEGMSQPILVRERITDMTPEELREYTVEANERTTLELSPSERAAADAEKMGDIVGLYRGGDLGSAANRDFVRAFVRDVVSQADRGRFMDSGGLLSPDGRRRMEAALVSRAYGDESLVIDLFESADSDIKAIGGALLDVAGSWAQMRREVRDGVISSAVDLTPNLLEAVNLIRRARAEGRPVAEIAGQNDIFSGEIDQATLDFLSLFYRGENLRRARGRDKVAGALQYYVDQARETRPGTNMFGDPEITGQDVLRSTNERLQREEQQATQQQDIFAGPRASNQDAGEPGGDRPGSQPTAEDAAPTPAGSGTEQSLTDTLYQHLQAGTLPSDNNGLRRLVAEFDGAEVDNARLKEAQEDLEAAMARYARDVVAEGGTDAEVFSRLRDLYESQPNLNIRTSTSVSNQAYSTPAPLAYVAARLAGIDRNTTVYEPTAGNGMLLLTADPAKATANEIEDQRFANLQAQGFDAIQGDALDAIESGAVIPGSQDAVITNPPFGSLKGDDGKATKVQVDGFRIGKIDHLIAAEALKAMKDDGRATLIIGADKKAGGVSTDDRIFFNWLYGNYNVVGHFEVDGKLYNRQGAGWPVRVITIDGRQASDRVSPRPGEVQRVNDWDGVYESFEQVLGAENRGAQPDAAPGSAGLQRPADDTRASQDADAGQAGAAGGRGRGGRGARGAGNVSRGGTRNVGNRGERAGQQLADRNTQQRPDDRTNAQDQLEPGDPRESATGSRDQGSAARTDAREPAGNALADADNAFQTRYVPRSSRKDEGVLVPVNMAQPLQDALSALEDAVGDIDQYVMRELGYDSVEALHDAMMGLQVDSVASAIHQIKDRQKGVIIADQTGIGKGRQAAAMIRWAARNDYTPVFVTVKPQLFTDMYGDLADIGSRDIDPFILNRAEWISGPNGEKLFANKASEHRKALEAIASSGELPEGRNALFMTYSQINTNNIQRQALSALAGRAIFVLDESHHAGGASNTGEFIQQILAEAPGAVYLSATYAKRPDNMPVYFKTDIGSAISDGGELMQAMAEGGLPLQTVVANNLVRAGQMFRRERSYDGVSIETVVDTANRQQHERLSDEATSALRLIVDADRLFHDGYVERLKKELEARGQALQDIAGNQASESVNHTEFSSVVHNFVRQMLLGLKANTAADSAIAALKRGEKPLIALENTMGSFLDEYATNNGLKPGDNLGDFDYRNVLSRALERTRYVVRVLPNGEKVKEFIPVDRLDSITRAAYERAQHEIDNLDIDIPVSPLDWIRHRLESAGYSVAEITGRDLAVDYSEAQPKLARVPTEEQNDKVATTRSFNDGNLDAIILNVAGSTGISLHASERFADQRKRHMIVAQPAQDINTFMQMLGRVHRTGQVQVPSYEILNADLPSEKRPTAILNQKMKSLNANTSSNTESATSIKAADMLNKYGDQVIGNYLDDDPELAAALNLTGGLVDSEGRGQEGIARKATGRMALMPVQVQKDFYAEVEEQYNSLLEYLNETNQNDLEPRTFDYEAEIQREVVIVDASDPNSPFGNEAVYGEYRIKAQGKQMTPDEVRAEMDKNLDGKTGEAHAQALIADLMAEAIRSRHEERLESARRNGPVNYPTRDGFAFMDEGQMLADPMDESRYMRDQGEVVAPGRNFIASHPIGSAWRIEINGEIFNAVVTNIRNTHRKKGNPFSLSKTQVTLAVNGPLRTVTIPASQWERIEVGPIHRTSIETMFSEQVEGTEIAKIITGNLLAAYGEMRGSSGTIISFTKKDGTIEQGILLPKKFDVRANTRGDFQFRNSADVIKFLTESRDENVERFGIATRDGVVRLRPRGNRIVMEVPRSKARGGKWYLDETLTGITGDFVSRGQNMVATFPIGDATRVVDHVMTRAPLYAPSSMAAEAREILGLPPRTDTEAGGDPRYSVGADAMTGQQLRAALNRGPLAGAISSLIDSGQIVIHDSVRDVLPNAPVGAQAATDGAGAIHLFADGLSRDAVMPVVLHEAFHGTVEPFIGTDRWNSLQRQLGALYRQAERSQGRMNSYWREAMTRIANAESAGVSLTDQQRIEEFGAYAIENYESAPASIRKWVDQIIGALKNWLQQRFGIQAGQVTPAQLRALAAASLRSAAQQAPVAPATASRTAGGMSIGDSSPSARDVTDTPAFREWFGDSKAVDENGQPLVMYHGTDSDFSEFSADAERLPWNADGAGHYFTTSRSAAEGYGSFVMPVYLKVENPKISENFEHTNVTAERIRELKAQGYDSIYFDGRYQNISGDWVQGNDEWVVFDPTQIKSATGNSGTFDPNNPDIRFSTAPPTDSEAFRRWFGDSKVVDADGEPMVVYHGTGADFSEFNVQMRDGQNKYYFARDPMVASEYAGGQRDVDFGATPNVMPVYLSVTEPFILDAEGRFWSDIPVSSLPDTMQAQIGVGKNDQDRRVHVSTVANAAAALGHDGVIVRNVRDSAGPYGDQNPTDVFITFRPEQVKSAIGNTGAFDPANPDIRYSIRPSRYFKDLDKDQKSLLDKIGPERLPVRLRDRLDQLRENLALRVRQAGVDRYSALLRNDRALYGEDTLEGSIASSSWVLARMSHSAGGAVSAMLNYGRIYLDADEKVIDVHENTRGLAETLRELGTPQEVDRFMGWIAANRARKLMEEGRENLFTAQEIDAGIKLSSGRLEDGRNRGVLYTKAWREFQQYRDDVLGIAEQAGIITPEQRETWSEEFYVPFYRVLDDDSIGGPSASSGLSRQQAFKKLKGGSQNLNDLLENTLLNFHHLLQASLKNQAAQQAVQNARELGIATPTTEAARDRKLSTFVMENGEKQWYNIDDPLTFKAISALGDAGLNTTAMKIGRAFKRTFTNLTTITPQFIAANLLRDTLSAMATSPTSGVPFKNAITGAITYGNSRNRARMLASGGAFSFGHIYGQNAGEIKASLRGTMREARVLKNPQLIPGALRNAWRKYNEVANFAENVNRAGIWEHNLEQGKLRAAFEARDLMDFSAHGDAALVRILIDLVPFMNARIQGLDKLYRSGVKPGAKTLTGKGTKADRRSFARFATVAGALSLVSMALYLRNYDDEEYRKLEDWQRDTYWYIRFGDNAFFIPKPFEVGAIGTMAERLLEQFVDPTVGGSKLAERFGHVLMDTFALNPMPQALRPAYELAINEEQFTGRPIESMGMERLSPSLRSRPGTSALSQGVSRGMESALNVVGAGDAALSPVQIDHLIRGYLGQVGASTLATSDVIWRRMMGEELPARRWSEYQPIRRFYKDLTLEDSYTRYGTDFYNALKEVDRIHANIRHLQEYEELERAHKLSEKHADKLAMRRALNRVQRDLSRINADMRRVQRDDNLSGEEKRMELDRLRSIRNTITERVGKDLEQQRVNRARDSARP